MNHRIRTVAASAALLTTGILAGLAIGSPAATATEPTPTSPTIDTPMPDMEDMDDMTGMMTSDMAAGMAQMMKSADMGTMHTAMHQQMAGVMDPDVLAACDSAHEQMAPDTDSGASSADAPSDQHDAHHEAVGS